MHRQALGNRLYKAFYKIKEKNNPKGKVFKMCCEAVLRNFFAAINDGKLEVLIDFSDRELFGDDFVFECNQGNIEDIFVNRFFNNPPYDQAKTSFFDKFNPYPYWLAYKNSDVTITDDMSQEEAITLASENKYICFRKDLPILGRALKNPSS